MLSHRAWFARVSIPGLRNSVMNASRVFSLACFRSRDRNALRLDSIKDLARTDFADAKTYHASYYRLYSVLMSGIMRTLPRTTSWLARSAPDRLRAVRALPAAESAASLEPQTCQQASSKEKGFGHVVVHAPQSSHEHIG